MFLEKLLKVIKIQKQIDLSSYLPKNERKSAKRVKSKDLCDVFLYFCITKNSFADTKEIILTYWLNID